MDDRATAGRTPRGGLSDAEVADLRREYGWNEIEDGQRVSPLVVLLRQFKGFLVLVLIAAAVIALAVGETIDAAAIGLVIFLNALLGFIQEWRAETALEALRGMMAPNALVIRNGVETTVPARELVPGDIVVLEAGDTVPADLALRHSAQLKLDESVLTGESVPVSKSHEESGTLLFSGTSVVHGRGEGQVATIGKATEFGHVAVLTGSVGEKETHIQRTLGTLARQLGLGAIAIAALIIVMGVVAGQSAREMFMTGLSLAVAVVPEGLPAVVTITLALGAHAMARRNALARRLQAVETLGAATVICTDKTGTLTENKMTATDIWMPEAVYRVTGTGYDPRGHIEKDGRRIRAADDPALSDLLDSALTCNHATLRREGNDWLMTGDPTEGALVVLAHKGWFDAPDDAVVTNELPFSSETKWMCTVSVRGTRTVAFAKGAPEVILPKCAAVRTASGTAAMDEGRLKAARDAYDEMAGRGLRVVALAMREADGQDISEDGLTLLGLAGLIDPPRAEVPAAVTLAQSAGIRVIMVTGDGPVTAKAIAGQLSIPAETVVTGDQLEGIADEKLSELLSAGTLFARVHPGDKMRIVRCLQAQDHIVAMTGDGVNDAPALKQADIGVSMGIRGTSVAKSASDLVLLDDNFSTIVGAIREGRRQFDNIQKFVRYLLSSNAGEVIAIVVNILIGGPLIFLATQILWMNLITDSVTAISLGLEKSETSQMKRPPRPRTQPILGWGGFALIALFGAYTGAASLFIFYHFLPSGEILARTAAFTAMVIFEKVSVFAFRSLTQPCWRIGWLSNPILLGALTLSLAAQIAAVYLPVLQGLLRTVPLAGEHWQMILLFALPIVILPEAVKSLRRE